MKWSNRQLVSGTLNSNNFTYSYDYANIRTSKTVNDTKTNYYVDGGTILAEERIAPFSQIEFIYYIYDITGVAGLIHTRGSTSTIYFYIKNALGDVVAITNSYGSIVAEYVYDAWGNILSVKSGTGTTILPTNTTHIANINPFRYRSYYYDTETGFYYLQTRYYDPEIRRFINKDSISLLPELAEVVGQLNLYAYCNNNPIAYTDESGEFIFSFLIGLAVSSLFMWGIGQAFGSQVAGGIGSLMNGGGAIATGVSLLAFGPIGLMLGGALILVGLSTIGLGFNEIIAGATGTNYLQQWTGMSDGLYSGLNMGLNMASGIGQIAGNIGMRIASNRILNSIIKNPAKVQKYSLWQMKTYGKYTSQYTVGTLKKGEHVGQGYTLTNKINPSNGYIQWHPGSRWHFGGKPYWKVTSGLLGSWRGPYLF